MSKTTAFFIFVASVICLAIVLLMPAVAQTVQSKTPPTELETCQNNRAYLGEYAKSLNSINTQLVNRIVELNKELNALKLLNASVPIPLPRLKPAHEPKVVEKLCPELTGKDKCKTGRWQDPAHGCQCGVWK